MIEILIYTLLTLVIILLIILAYGSYVSSTSYIDKQIKKKINSKSVLKSSTLRKIKNDKILFTELPLIKEALKCDGYLILFAWLDYYDLFIEYIFRVREADGSLERHLSYHYTFFHRPDYEELLYRIQISRKINNSLFTWELLHKNWRKYIKDSKMVSQEYGKYELENSIIKFQVKKIGK